MPRSSRALGWAVSLIAWAIASDGHPLLALVSVLAAVAVRTIYLMAAGGGKARSVIVSPWFFAVAATCELLWLAGSSFHT